MSNILCPRCRERPKAPGDGYCTPCRNEYARDYQRLKKGGGKVSTGTRRQQKLLAPFQDNEGNVIRCIACSGPHYGRDDPTRWAMYVCDQCVPTVDTIRNWGSVAVARLLEYLANGGEITASGRGFHPPGLPPEGQERTWWQQKAEPEEDPWKVWERGEARLGPPTKEQLQSMEPYEWEDVTEEEMGSLTEPQDGKIDP